MTDAGHDGIVAAEEALDLLSLGGRLDDNQVLNLGCFHLVKYSTIRKHPDRTNPVGALRAWGGSYSTTMAIPSVRIESFIVWPVSMTGHPSSTTPLGEIRNALLLSTLGGSRWTSFLLER